jgi:hypothetical protein
MTPAIDYSHPLLQIPLPHDLLAAATAAAALAAATSSSLRLVSSRPLGLRSLQFFLCSASILTASTRLASNTRFCSSSSLLASTLSATSFLACLAFSLRASARSAFSFPQRLRSSCLQSSLSRGTVNRCSHTPLTSTANSLLPSM